MLGDFGKLIVAKGFKKLPKVDKIARSGHTGGIFSLCNKAIACAYVGRQQVRLWEISKEQYYNLAI